MAHNYCKCWGNRGGCIDCAEEEIDLLTAQLAEARAEVAELKDFKKALERIANTPDDYEMEYCRNIAIIALGELI